MYRFTPEFHHPKNKKAFKKADIWPADVLVDSLGKHLEYWVMTADANFIPLGSESEHIMKQKVESNV